MNSPREKREALSAWSLLGRDYAALCNAHANCSCDDAETLPGTHGPVDDAEKILYVVRSRFDIDLKDKKLPIKEKCLTKLFKSGLSHIRLEKSDGNELKETMSLLHSTALEKDNVYGGLVGVILTQASIWRSAVVEDRRLCCVFDTPSGQREDGSFERPSHCDVIFSSADYHKLDPKEQQQIRAIILNTTDFLNLFQDIEDFREGEFAHLQPAQRKQ